MTLRMTHPEAGDAVCADVAQFEAIHAPRGWQLVTDADGAPVAGDDNPTAHIVPTPLTPDEVAAATAPPEKVETFTVDPPKKRTRRATPTDDGEAVTTPAEEA